MAATPEDDIEDLAEDLETEGPDDDPDDDDLDEADLDDVDLDDNLVVDLDDSADLLEDDADDEEDEDEEEKAPARPAGEDDDDEEPDPDDVEADLDTILKDRLDSSEDEEDDEEEAAAPVTPETGERVTPKREDEWTCEGCFLIVSARMFGRRSNPQCPSGEDPCPSLARL